MNNFDIKNYNPNYQENPSKELQSKKLDELMEGVISATDGYDNTYLEENYQDTHSNISDQTAFYLSLMTGNPFMYIPTGAVLLARNLIDRVTKRDWMGQRFNGYSNAELKQDEPTEMDLSLKLRKPKVDPVKHMALITLVTASVLTGYFKDNPNEQPDTEDFENAVNNINDIVDNSYHVRQIPQVVIDGDDVYVPQAQVSTGEVSSSNSETTVIGRITAFGDVSANGYLITAGLSSDLPEDASFNDVMANQVTSIDTDVRVNLSGLIELDSRSVANIELEMNYSIQSGQTIRIPRTFFDSVNNNFFELRTIELRNNGVLIPQEDFEITQLTDGNWTLSFSNPNIQGEINLRGQMLLRSENPIDVSSNPFYYQNVDSEQLSESLSWLADPNSFENSPQSIRTLAGIFSSQLQYSLRPTSTNPDLVNMPLEQFANEIILNYAEAMCSVSNVTFGTLLSSYYEQGLLDPNNIDHMYYLAQGYLMMSGGDETANVSTVNLHMFGMGDDGMIDATASNGVSNDPDTTQYLLELSRAIAANSENPEAVAGMDVITQFNNQNLQNLANNPNATNPDAQTNYLQKLFIVLSALTLASGAAVGAGVGIWKFFEKSSLPNDIYKYVGAKTPTEKALVSTFLIRRRYSLIKQVPERGDRDFKLELDKTPDKKFRAYVKKNKGKLEGVLGQYRKKLSEEKNRQEALEKINKMEL